LPGGGGGGGADPFAGGGDIYRDRFPQSYEEYLRQKAGGGSGEGAGSSEYVSYDNETGEVTLRLPPKYEKYAQDLMEALYEEYFGAPAGSEAKRAEMNTWVADWLKKREEEDATSGLNIEL
jgi:hypothetical protein